MNYERVIEAVKRAGSLILDKDMAGDIHEKGKADFVTLVDLTIQERLKKELGVIAPNAQFMGEEQDNSAVSDEGELWILDPVDGTANLIRGYGHSSVSLAYAVKGEVQFGIVYDPFWNELFYAERGKGAYMNGKKLSIIQEESFNKWRISVGAAPGMKKQSHKTFEVMRQVYEQCWDIRRLGSCALELCYVACGRQDGYYEFGLSPWDYAAGMLIVQEAGGAVLTPDGRIPSLIKTGDYVIAGNTAVVKALSAIINSVF